MPIEYDDSNLRQLFAELEPKRRTQALKGAFRREANQVRKTAVNNLRSGGINSIKDLEKGVRAVVFKRAAGFRITIGTKKAGKSGKGEAGYHTNRQGLKKPILIWAETGTADRKTKSNGGRHTRMWTRRKRSGHSTGRMRRYGFMAQTLSDVRGTVTQELHEMVIDNVQKVAKKYGCK